MDQRLMATVTLAMTVAGCNFQVAEEEALEVATQEISGSKEVIASPDGSPMPYVNHHDVHAAWIRTSPNPMGGGQTVGMGLVAYTRDAGTDLRERAAFSFNTGWKTNASWSTNPDSPNPSVVEDPLDTFYLFTIWPRPDNLCDTSAGPDYVDCTGNPMDHSGRIR